MDLQLASKPLPQRKWNDHPSNNKVVAIVFIHLGKPPFVKLLTGTVIPLDGKLSSRMDMPATYRTVHGNKCAVRITYEEYVACVREAVEHFFPTGGPHAGTRAAERRRQALSKLTLVHDRLLSHGLLPIPLGPNEPSLHTIRLPPRSCDLDPLDYGVFGTAKRATRKQFYEHRNWDDESNFFVTKLQTMNTDKIINQFPERVNKCIAAKGGHFERNAKPHDVY